MSDAKIDEQIVDSLAKPAPAKPAAPAGPMSMFDEVLLDLAEAILAKNPDLPANELLNLPEVNPKLANGLNKLAADKALQQRINSTVELAAKFKGLDGAPGSVSLDLDIKNYDQARKSRMLQTVLSEDPKRIVDFLVEEIGEATPELSLGGAERAANGVSIKENPKPAPPK